ncbi:hypothetical protein CPC08DRAFT_727672 [Agrocybe pediades]|nr:hypothetical protein CPC08DRAFT_727672 [Agrocybe pediades]
MSATFNSLPTELKRLIFHYLMVYEDGDSGPGKKFIYSFMDDRHPLHGAIRVCKEWRKIIIEDSLAAYGCPKMGRTHHMKMIGVNVFAKIIHSENFFPDVHQAEEPAQRSTQPEEKTMLINNETQGMCMPLVESEEVREEGEYELMNQSQIFSSNNQDLLDMKSN